MCHNQKTNKAYESIYNDAALQSNIPKNRYLPRGCRSGEMAGRKKTTPKKQRVTHKLSKVG
jgi:hypothetical protein